jgi:cell division protein FtsB
MRRSRNNYRKRRNFRAFAVIVSFFIVVYALAVPTQHYFSQRAQINQLQSEVNSNQKSLEDARRELSQWKNPEFVKSEARSRLHFVMPGERKYVITGAENLDETPESLKITEGATHGVPWYTRLISSITETSK